MEEVSTLVTITLSSPAFENGDEMPQRYTCDGENINPEFDLDNIPTNTVSLALLLEDPDAAPGTWTHWLIWNIPPQQKIEENTTEGIHGNTNFGTTLYTGPCPAMGTHRYFFRVYALDTTLDLPPGSTRDELLKAMEYHIIGKGELMAFYSQRT